MQFYAATAGRESAELVALSLSIELERTERAGTRVVRLGPTTVSSASRVGLACRRSASLASAATGGAARLVAAAGGDGADVDARGRRARRWVRPGRDGSAGGRRVADGAGDLRGPGLALGDPRGRVGMGTDRGIGRAQARPRRHGPAVLAPWERFVLGLDEALEEFWRERDGFRRRLGSRRSVPSPSDRSGPPPRAADELAIAPDGWVRAMRIEPGSARRCRAANRRMCPLSLARAMSARSMPPIARLGDATRSGVARAGSARSTDDPGSSSQARTSPDLVRRRPGRFPLVTGQWRLVGGSH